MHPFLISFFILFISIDSTNSAAGKGQDVTVRVLYFVDIGLFGKWEKLIKKEWREAAIAVSWFYAKVFMKVRDELKEEFNGKKLNFDLVIKNSFIAESLAFLNREREAGEISLSEALRSFSDYLTQQRYAEYHSYNMAFIFTSTKVSSTLPDNPPITDDSMKTTGVIVQKRSTDGPATSVAIIEEKGFYEVVNKVKLEILLALSGGRSEGECRPLKESGEGSRRRVTPCFKKLLQSSISNMEAFLVSKEASDGIPSIFQSPVLTAGDQCKILYGDWFTNCEGSPNDVCQALFCMVNADCKNLDANKALDGTECANGGKECRASKCA